MSSDIGASIDIGKEALQRQIHASMNTLKNELFQDIEPFPGSVELSDIYKELVEVINLHVVLPKHADVTLALFIIASYIQDKLDISTYISITSATKRCGKSTLLRLLNKLVFNQVYAANFSTAALFRTIDKYEATLLIDEGDTFLHDDEKRGILNSGLDRETAVVIRCEGKNHEPRPFKTFGFKVISGIGALHPVLADRCIDIRLIRKLEKVTIKKLNNTVNYDVLRSKLMKWKLSVETVDTSRPELYLDEINDRAGDIWSNLMIVADMISEDVVIQAKKAAIALSGANDKDEDEQSILLHDIKEIFNNGINEIFSQDLVERLNKIQESPWETILPNGLNQHLLAKMLREFKIRPQLIRINGEQKRGYAANQFCDVFDIYTESR